jgi:hypothetical protein
MNRPRGRNSRNPARLAKVSVSLPFGLGSAEWVSDPAERQAAWSLYIELMTRVAVQPIGPDEGSVREALTSLYSLFDSTREVLRAAGPAAGMGKPSVGGIAIAVLHKGLRPFLTKWHVKLRDWESQRPQGRSVLAHENDWPEAREFRTDLDTLRSQLSTYAQALGEIAGAVG